MSQPRLRVFLALLVGSNCGARAVPTNVVARAEDAVDKGRGSTATLMRYLRDLSSVGLVIEGSADRYGGRQGSLASIWYPTPLGVEMGLALRAAGGDRLPLTELHALLRGLAGDAKIRGAVLKANSLAGAILRVDSKIAQLLLLSSPPQPPASPPTVSN